MTWLIAEKTFDVASFQGVRTSCCINWYDRRFSYVSFTFFLFIFVYCIPLVILVVSNTVTLMGLKRMRQKIEHGLHAALNRKRIEMERRIVKSKQQIFSLTTIDLIRFCL